MKWIDINEIAIELIENYPEIDPRNILFTDLHKWILSLEDFEDEPNRSIISKGPKLQPNPFFIASSIDIISRDIFSAMFKT